MAGETSVPFIWGPGGQQMTPEQIKRERALAEALMRSGMDTSPIRSPWQGAARMVQALVGGIRERAADQAERGAFAADAAARAGIFGGGNAAGPSAVTRPDVVTGSAGAAPAAPATSGDPAASNIPASLIRTESGGRWGAQNNARGAGGSVGHFGRLQFGQARLSEAAAAGAIPAGTTPQQFMASPQLQQAAERWHFNDIDNFIRTNGLDRAIGQTINGVPVTADGMRAVAHLGGTTGLRRFIETGGRYNPADRNGTSLLSYLRTHASQRPLGGGTAMAATSGDGAGLDPALAASVAAELGLSQTAPVSTAEPPLIDGRVLPQEAAAVPAVGMVASAQADAPQSPLIDGRELPPDQPQMPAPAMSPSAPLPPTRPVQAAAMAPVPTPRPNIELPPGAAPAGPVPAAAPPGASVARALMGGMSERDRLMLLRDEGSLGGGEADALRAGLPQGSGIAQALMARPQSAAPPVSPVAQALIAPQAAGAPPAQPQGAPVQMQAPGGAQPVAAPPAAVPAANNGGEIARLQAIIGSPDPRISQATRQMAFERLQKLTDPAAQEALRAAQLANRDAERRVNAPLPNSPEAAAAQRRQRELDADAAGLTGEERRRFVLTGQISDRTTFRNVTDPAERAALGISPTDRRPYQVDNTGRLSAVGGTQQPEVSAADKRAGREAIDEMPTVRSTIASLNRALALNDNAYSGYTAGALAGIGTSGIPGAGFIADPKRAEASREFNQLMTGQAIESMAATLKGATTDREMAQFVEILGNPATPPAIRRRTIERMLNVARMKEAILTDRIGLLPENERRSLDRVSPIGGAPASSEGATATNPQTGQRIQFRGGQWVPMQ